MGKFLWLNMNLKSQPKMEERAVPRFTSEPVHEQGYPLNRVMHLNLILRNCQKRKDAGLFTTLSSERRTDWSSSARGAKMSETCRKHAGTSNS